MTFLSPLALIAIAALQLPLNGLFFYQFPSQPVREKKTFSIPSAEESFALNFI